MESRKRRRRILQGESSDDDEAISRAAVCTGLNSDEDPDVREELEDEEDADEDSWDGDWDIGSLTDEESDAELEKLPESV
ncbi:hypothetical protein PR002_g16560 [Phytophthora rubi]|uniref:Uncharacterized protein n=1 Tax=Phytophthora rubi TaxID=129364 RepID=A0A6A3KFI5_9STRA|nr:hypothetical protein PR002_g16560 [Phytophthora rubi]